MTFAGFLWYFSIEDISMFLIASAYLNFLIEFMSSMFFRNSHPAVVPDVEKKSFKQVYLHNILITSSVSSFFLPFNAFCNKLVMVVLDSLSVCMYLLVRNDDLLLFP